MDFREQARAKCREYYWANRESQLARKASYRAANPEKVKDCMAVSRAKNLEAYKARDKEYKKLPSVVDRRNSMRRRRYAEDPQFKLALRVRNRLNLALKHRSRPSSLITGVGCSIAELVAHIEAQFAPGMSWVNWGRGKGKWHLDHIIPLSSFDLTDPLQFAKATHYSNLQPLWEEDNLKKGSHVY